MFIIPRRLAKRTELFDGVGLKEIGIFSFFFLIGVVVFFSLSVVGVGLLPRLIALVIISAIGVGLIYPLEFNDNMIILGMRMLKYRNQQNIYFFHRGTGGFLPPKR